MKTEELKKWVDKIIACNKRHSEGDQIGGQYPESILAEFEKEVLVKEKELIKSAKRLADYVRLSMEIGLIEKDAPITIAYRDFIIDYNEYKQSETPKN